MSLDIQNRIAPQADWAPANSKQPTQTDQTSQSINLGDHRQHTVGVSSNASPPQGISAANLSVMPEFSPIASSNPNAKAIHTQADLAQAQQTMISEALQKLDTTFPHPQSQEVADTRHTLEQLKASLDPSHLSEPNKAPTKGSIEIAKTLGQNLSSLLVKAGVPAAETTFSENATLTFPSPISTGMLAKLQAKQIEAALQILKSRQDAEQAAGLGQVKGGKFDAAIQTLENLQKSVLQTVTHKGEEDVTKTQLKTAKGLEKSLVALVADQIGQDPKTVRAEWKENCTALQNQQEWQPVETCFNHNGVTYTSNQTPAGQLKLGEHSLLPSYEGKGISSASTKETDHAVNLWTSTFSDGNQTLFKGVRHAILSPFGLKKDDPDRAIGAENRAKEVVIAALALDEKKLADALDGETVTIRLASTSLVTATDLPSNHEGPQIQDQITAWKNLSATNPVSLQIAGANGEMKTVSVKVEVAAFNFGVNEIALSLGPFGLGWKQSDAYNADAFPQMVGSMTKGTEIGGWAGEFLASNAPAEEKAFVRDLVGQMRDIWADKSHHYDGNEPYKMATRVSVLANAIGVTPAWNCKSGKDRTGMLDAEIKNMLVHQQQHPEAPLKAPGATLSETDKKLYRDTLEKTGNLEIQEYNTGVQGNKAMSAHRLKLSLRDRVGDSDFADKMKGLSSLVKS